MNGYQTRMYGALEKFFRRLKEDSMERELKVMPACQVFLAGLSEVNGPDQRFKEVTWSICTRERAYIPDMVSSIKAEPGVQNVLVMQWRPDCGFRHLHLNQYQGETDRGASWLSTAWEMPDSLSSAFDLLGAMAEKDCDVMDRSTALLHFQEPEPHVKGG